MVAGMLSVQMAGYPKRNLGDHNVNTCFTLVDDANAVLPKLFEAAAATGTRITSVNVVEPNLETVFLHLTGRALRE